MYDSRQFKCVLRWRIRKFVLTCREPLNYKDTKSPATYNGYHIYLKSSSSYKFHSTNEDINITDINEEVVMKINTFKDMYSPRSSPPLTKYPAVTHHRKNMKRYFVTYVQEQMWILSNSLPKPTTSWAVTAVPLTPKLSTHINPASTINSSSATLQSTSSTINSSSSTVHSTSPIVTCTPHNLDEDVADDVTEHAWNYGRDKSSSSGNAATVAFIYICAGVELTSNDGEVWHYPVKIGVCLCAKGTNRESYLRKRYGTLWPSFFYETFDVEVTQTNQIRTLENTLRHQLEHYMQQCPTQLNRLQSKQSQSLSFMKYSAPTKASRLELLQFRGTRFLFSDNPVDKELQELTRRLGCKDLVQNQEIRYSSNLFVVNATQTKEFPEQNELPQGEAENLLLFYANVIESMIHDIRTLGHTNFMNKEYLAQLQRSNPNLVKVKINKQCLRTLQELYRDGIDMHGVGNHLVGGGHQPLSISTVWKIFKQLLRLCLSKKKNMIICWAGCGYCEELVALCLLFNYYDVEYRISKIYAFDLFETAVNIGQEFIKKHSLQSIITVNQQNLFLMNCNELHDTFGVSDDVVKVMYTSAAVDKIFSIKLFYLSVVNNFTHLVSDSKNLDNIMETFPDTKHNSTMMCRGYLSQELKTQTLRQITKITQVDAQPDIKSARFNVQQTKFIDLRRYKYLDVDVDVDLEESSIENVSSFLFDYVSEEAEQGNNCVIKKRGRKMSSKACQKKKVKHTNSDRHQDQNDDEIDEDKEEEEYEDNEDEDEEEYEDDEEYEKDEENEDDDEHDDENDEDDENEEEYDENDDENDEDEEDEENEEENDEDDYALSEQNDEAVGKEVFRSKHRRKMSSRACQKKSNTDCQLLQRNVHRLDLTSYLSRKGQDYHVLLDAIRKVLDTMVSDTIDRVLGTISDGRWVTSSKFTCSILERLQRLSTTFSSRQTAQPFVVSYSAASDQLFSVCPPPWKISEKNLRQLFISDEEAANNFPKFFRLIRQYFDDCFAESNCLSNRQDERDSSKG